MKNRTSNPFNLAASLKRRKTVTSNDSGLFIDGANPIDQQKGGTFKNNMKRKLSLQPSTPNNAIRGFSDAMATNQHRLNGRSQLQKLADEEESSKDNFPRFGMHSSFDKSAGNNIK